MTLSELAILGLLVEKPQHGYELEEVIEARNMRDWTDIGFSSIYAILSRLEEEGLIEHTIRPSEKQGPPRKVYSATAAGRKAWETASLELLGSEEGGQLSFLLGLTAFPALPHELAIEALKRHAANLRLRERRVAERQLEIGPEPPLFLRGIFEFSLMLLRAEIEWTESFIQRAASERVKTPDTESRGQRAGS